MQNQFNTIRQCHTRFECPSNIANRDDRSTEQNKQLNLKIWEKTVSKVKKFKKKKKLKQFYRVKVEIEKENIYKN